MMKLSKKVIMITVASCFPVVCFLIVFFQQGHDPAMLQFWNQGQEPHTLRTDPRTINDQDQNEVPQNVSLDIRNEMRSGQVLLAQNKPLAHRDEMNMEQRTYHGEVSTSIVSNEVFDYTADTTIKNTIIDNPGKSNSRVDFSKADPDISAVDL